MGRTAMDGLLNNKATSNDDNFYELLGCDERSTVSIHRLVDYSIMILVTDQLHPGVGPLPPTLVKFLEPI